MKNNKLLPKITYLVFSVWILAQIIVIIYFWGVPQRSDQGLYMRTAEACFQKGEWYPTMEDVYSLYICAQGIINFLILQLRLFGTMNLNVIFNLLMNIGIALEIFYLGKKLFNKQTAYLSVILWCLLYSNLMIVLPAGTEVPFLFLALSAFCLCLQPNTWLMIAAGFIFVIANWVRPLSVIFIFTVVLYMLWQKYSWKNYMGLFVSMAITAFIIGKVTENKIGYFSFQASTSGINLVMTANDKAYGGVATSLVLKDSTNTSYIKNAEQYTFQEKDLIWRSRAIEWIKENPGRYIQLYFLKIGGMYIEDSWSDRPILGGDGFIDSFVVEQSVEKNTFKKEVFIRGLKSLVYYFMLLLCLYSLIVHRKELLSQITGKGILFLLLVVGTLTTCIFTVSPRYHYPILFVVTLFAGYGLDHYLNRKEEKKKIG